MLAINFLRFHHYHTTVVKLHLVKALFAADQGFAQGFPPCPLIGHRSRATRTEKLKVSHLVFLNFQVVRPHLLVYAVVDIGKLPQTAGNFTLVPLQEHVVLGEFLECPLLVRSLIPPVAMLRSGTRGGVDDSNAVLLRVFMLPARSACAEGLNLKILLG